MITPAHQAAEFAFCFLAGAAACALYSPLRFLLLKLWPKKLPLFIFDFISVALSALLLFWVIEGVNYGQALYYHFVGFALGAYAVRALIVRVLVPASEKLNKKAEGLYKKLQRLPFIRILFK